MPSERIATKGDVAPALYLDTSAVLRGILESGLTADMSRRIASAPALITSRLALVEASRALIRVRQLTPVSETRLADVARQLDMLWARCDIWELTAEVCELAATVSPSRPLRTLDALHLATFLLARRKIGDIEMVTADKRLQDAAEVS